VKYADDTTVIAGDEHQLHELMDVMIEECKERTGNQQETVFRGLKECY